MRALGTLFFTFARIGLFTFGGGYAMLALIERACVEERGWITPEELAEITVLAESTPGPVSINCATYVGYKRGGLPGAVAATVGVVLPSFLILLLLSQVLAGFLAIPWVGSAFRGIRVAVGLLIIKVGLKMARQNAKRPLHKGIFAFSLAAMLVIALFALPLSSVTLLFCGGAAGLLAWRWGK